jgi:hypothetical protein
VPYASVAELPPHAREIFLQAFNHAWEEIRCAVDAPRRLVPGGDGDAGGVGGGEATLRQDR